MPRVLSSYRCFVQLSYRKSPVVVCVKWKIGLCYFFCETFLKGAVKREKLFRIFLTKSKKSQQSKFSFYECENRVFEPCPCRLRQTRRPLKSSDGLACVKWRPRLWQASGSNSMNERLKHRVSGGKRPFFRPKYVKNGNQSILFPTIRKHNLLAFMQLAENAQNSVLFNRRQCCLKRTESQSTLLWFNFDKWGALSIEHWIVTTQSSAIWPLLTPPVGGEKATFERRNKPVLPLQGELEEVTQTMTE